MDTIQCKYCGTSNEAGNAMCVNCQSPLTAYGGQITGVNYQGKLAAQAELLQRRPVAVVIVTTMLAFIAIGGPLRYIAAMVWAYVSRTHSEEGYLSSAFGVLGPIAAAVLCLPIACVIFWVAYEAVHQQPRAWRFGCGILFCYVGYLAIHFREGIMWNLLWLVPVLISCGLWMAPKTRAWFGLG